MAPDECPQASLASLGIKVRDFAYENTLPALAPVPRVPRQVQPTPRAPKRSHRDWDDQGDPHPLAGKADARSLDRRPTEPLQEPAVQHTRTLGRITVRRLCSILIPPPRTRFSASPPTSPLTPSLSHVASQDSQLVQTPPAFPFVVHVDDATSSQSQPVPFRPTRYTRFALDSRPSLRCSPAPSPQNASPAPLTSPFLALPSPKKELEVDPRVRKRRRREIAGMTPPPNRYQLRQRPAPSSRTSTLSRRAQQCK